MINAAVFGLGRWGRRLVDSVQERGTPKGGKIRFRTAIVRTMDSHRDYAANQGLALSGSFDDVCADASIDAVVLATPHHLHAEQIIAASKAGKHVFVEKPLALKLADAEAAVKAANDAGIVLAVGFNRRFLPAAEHLKAMLGNNEFGQPLHIEGNFANDSGLKYHAGMWRASESGPLSAMTAMGVHVLDFFIHLLGPVSSVRTMSTRRATPVEVDDIVCVNLRFRSGATGSMSTILSTPRLWRIQLFGTALWAHMRDENLLDLSATGQPLDVRSFDNVDTVQLELNAFADAIAGNQPYRVPAGDALNGVATLEALLQSAAAGGAEIPVRESAAS